MKQQQKKKLYQWQAIDEAGHTQQGIDPAINKDELEQNLFAQKLIPIKIKRYRPSLYQRYRSRINQNFITQWTRQLATLLDAKIPLSEGIAISAKAAPFYLQRQFILSIHQSIKQGFSLSASLQHSSYFNPTYIAMIKAGETSGQLISTLTTLADYRERRASLQKRIKNALIYPTLISIFSLTITIAMLLFIVPQFNQFYAALNTPLPALTEFMLTIANLLKTISLTEIIIFLIALFSLRWLYKKHQKNAQAALEPALLKLPIIGPLKKKSILNTFCHTLSILFQSDHHLPTTIEIAIQATNSSKLMKQTTSICFDLKQGTSLYQSLKKQSFFPDMALQMIHAGEHSNQLHTILKQLSTLYENELKQTTDTLIKLLEPLTIIFIGGLVGFIVIALYLPVFQLGSIL
ncbi:type II secretion system F family protein [Piscirickettsia litoralis]|uniref:Type II secretion system protein GspF domain-containing protein n=1 Tax=Piscirickettsia litoralis TaxID=1891921 RepID=A0ABX3A5B6_9GAMM|nr:type II secretion system F family protein [Piscirickettsia litoralis]ODN42833.1 hypothetical protein BGC07_07735 [Piscirickettsia litoralis]